MLCVINRVNYGPMVVFVCWHHYADVFEGVELNMLVEYILPSMRRRLSQFFQLYSMQYMGLCVFGVPISLLIIVLHHWSRVTHVCVSKLPIRGSDNGLSPGRRQASI